MKSIKRNSLFAAAIVCSTVFLAGSGQAQSTFMEECSAKWKAAKAANSVPAGTTWPSFMKTECSADSAEKAAPAKKAKASEVKEPTPAPEENTVTKATKKRVSKTAPAAEEDATPPEPTVADDAPAAATDKNGKPFTPGQIAAHQRMKQCGAEWRAAKAAGKIRDGQTWPKYWSSCNTRLKK